MAVAGMQNVSVFSPSFFGEPRSPVSRGCSDEQVRPTTRASSLLQMWRELEERNDLGTECLSRSTSMGNGSENGDGISESNDEIEHQGVTGSEMEHDDKSSILSEQSSDLGEIERERVRQTFREWMNSGGKGRSANRFCHGPQWLGENERGRVRIIREWVQMNIQQRNNYESHGDGVAEVDSQIEQVRDGLEINNHGIGERRTIRRLCGRQTLVDLLLRSQSERERELTGLSERKPVSDFGHRNRIQALLRGRFLRNERSIPDERPSSRAETELGLLTQRHTVSDLREGFISKLDKSASTSINNNEGNSSSSDETNSESDSTPRETEVTKNRTSSDMEMAVDGSGGQENFVVHVSDVHDPTLRIEQVLNEQSRNEPILDFESSVREVLNDVDHLSSRNGEQLNVNITPDSLSETDGIIYGDGALEVFHEQFDSRSAASYANETAGQANELERNASEEYIWLNTSADVEEFDWGNSPEQDGMVEPQEQWPAHDFQEAINSWLEMPSEEVGSQVGRNNTSYIPDDDDTVRNVELRQLFSRRRVSSLLGSSFRHNLDQVLQSHAERLGQATDDWELENTSSPALIEQDQEPINGDQVVPEPGWDEDFQRANRPQNYLNHQFGTEWEVINDLKIDMAMLQQRMNNMQSMLETCIEMQVELQRAVRQEVSAALNRPIFSRDADMSEGSTRHDESNWDQIRMGICCLCSDSKIDSLLYRCGHMSTCSKCAENLVQLAGKCPMCHAPVIEMVRAYFIQ